MPIPIHAKLGILKACIMGNKKAALGTNRNVAVSGLVALVKAIVLQNTAHDPVHPHKTISQWKNMSNV